MYEEVKKTKIPSCKFQSLSYSSVSPKVGRTFLFNGETMEITTEINAIEPFLFADSFACAKRDDDDFDDYDEDEDFDDYDDDEDEDFDDDDDDFDDDFDGFDDDEDDDDDEDADDDEEDDEERYDKYGFGIYGDDDDEDEDEEDDEEDDEY